MQTLQCEIERLKQYELETWESECCRSLADIRVIDGIAYWDYSGCTNIADLVKPSKKDGINDRLIRLISAVRKITEGVQLAEDYLIESEHISLDVDKLWFSKTENTVKLLPQNAADAESYIHRICNLLERIDAEDLAEKIEEQNQESAMSYFDLISYLSSWELELL